MRWALIPLFISMIVWWLYLRPEQNNEVEIESESTSLKKLSRQKKIEALEELADLYPEKKNDQPEANDNPSDEKDEDQVDTPLPFNEESSDDSEEENDNPSESPFVPIDPTESNESGE
ncbi:MAG: hypothetical protein AB7I27_17580 [Bacteriovoracaceae bacterium]